MNRFKLMINIFLYLLCALLLIFIIILFNKDTVKEVTLKYNEKELPSFKSQESNKKLESIYSIAKLFGYRPKSNKVKIIEKKVIPNSNIKYIGTIKDNEGIEYYYFKDQSNNKILKASTVKTDKYYFINKIDKNYFYINKDGEKLLVKRL